MNYLKRYKSSLITIDPFLITHLKIISDHKKKLCSILLKHDGARSTLVAKYRKHILYNVGSAQVL